MELMVQVSICECRLIKCNFFALNFLSCIIKVWIYLSPLLLFLFIDMVKDGTLVKLQKMDVE